ncbi:MAG: SH3 domain-containing protein [Lachnospiraceae bacterium]|nr:SH3 domain-containing protein [Lachnospiraceae bacterium]
MKKNKSRMSGRVVRSEASQQLKYVMADNLRYFKEWFSDYLKFILPVALLILVSVTLVISLGARKKVEAAAIMANSAIEETKPDINEVVESPFEINAHEDLNELIERYYSALEVADVEAITEMQNVVTNTELIRLRKMSEYIGRYENFKVYSKPGPYEGSYLVYVYSDIFLKEREDSFPGLQAFYVCTNEAGNLYINNGEISDREAEYIKSIVAQSDVVDLKNNVKVAYNTVMESNEDLSRYWAKVSVDIDLGVGEQLALEARLLAQLEEEMNKNNPEGEGEGETGEEETPVITKMRTKEYVNVRKSASAGADLIGAAAAGEVYEVIEQMNNGWTKVKYGKTEGFINTAYLEPIEDIGKYQTSGKVTATTVLNVRKEPGTDAAKLGVLTQGETVELIETVDGWCKIKFKGQIGYVSAEYVK